MKNLKESLITILIAVVISVGISSGIIYNNKSNDMLGLTTGFLDGKVNSVGIKIFEPTAATSTEILASTTQLADLILYLPIEDGSDGDFLQTDGSGNLSFIASTAWSFSTTTLDYWFDNTAGITGNSNIELLGTIATGTWNGTVVATNYGGTGQDFSASNGLIFLTTGTASAIATSTLKIDYSDMVGIVANTAGGTGQDSSGWTGFSYVNGGTWSASGTISASAIDDVYLLNTGDAGTGIYDFGDATSFEMPNTLPTIDTTGEFGLSTTSDQIQYYGTTTKRVLSYEKTAVITIASSTWEGQAGTATSTIQIGTPRSAETYLNVSCYTDTGTAWIRAGDGTNFMTSISCSSTESNVDVSSNNTFTSREKRELEIGSFASTPNYITITITKTITAD